MFAIRKGDWKLILCPGSGGWSDPIDSKAKELGLPNIQLYDMNIDIIEQQNLQSERPEVVQELVMELKGFVERGRSTMGEKLKNDIDSIDLWKGVPPKSIN